MKRLGDASRLLGACRSVVDGDLVKVTSALLAGRNAAHIKLTTQLPRVSQVIQIVFIIVNYRFLKGYSKAKCRVMPGLFTSTASHTVGCTEVEFLYKYLS